MEYKNIFEIEFIQRTQEIVNGYQIPFENTLFINAKIVVVCSSLATVTFEKGSQLKTIGGGGSSYYGAFGQLKNLMTVDMSACTQVKTIGESAFDGDSELRLFKIGTETPPTCGRDAFSGINPYSVLKVPSGCADAYKAKSGWNNFASITGLDE